MEQWGIGVILLLENIASYPLLPICLLLPF